MTVLDVVKRLVGSGRYQLCCDSCGQSGKTGADRDELQSLTDLHNQLLHRGQQVAQVRAA